jgi:hypothetical protein
MDVTGAELRETVDHIAIRRLQDAYADIVTRRAWAELADIFLPGTRVVVDTRAGEPVTLEGPGNVGAWIGRAIERFDHYQFVILGTRVFLRHGGDGDAATARMYMCEIRHDKDNGRRTIAYGVYHDRFRRVDGRWWFADRRYHSLARTGPDLNVFPFPEPGTFAPSR